MQVSWDNKYYEGANTKANASNLAYTMGNTAESWMIHCQARGLFLCDAVQSACLVPLAAVGVTFALIHAGCFFSKEKIGPAWQFFEKKCNHLLLSIFGATISPKYAHMYRNSRWPVYVVAIVRGTLVTSVLLYYGLFR